MFTNILLSIGLLVAAVGPPDFSGLPVIDQGAALCPDGSGKVVEIVIYDADPNDPEAAIRTFSMGGQVFAALDHKNKTVYIYGEKKSYTLDEIAQKYPNPCDIPAGQGI